MNIDHSIERRPIINELIQLYPQLFANSVVIGVDNGNLVCSTLMRNSDKLDVITFYENFSLMDDELTARFKAEYTKWLTCHNNLRILYEDGSNYAGVPNFINFNAVHPNIKSAIDDKRFSETLFCLEGWGCQIPATVDVAVLIKEEKVYPVFLEAKFQGIYFTTSKKHYDTCTAAFRDVFEKQEMDVYLTGGTMRTATKWHKKYGFC